MSIETSLTVDSPFPSEAQNLLHNSNYYQAVQYQQPQQSSNIDFAQYHPQPPQFYDEQQGEPTKLYQLNQPVQPLLTEQSQDVDDDDYNGNQVAFQDFHNSYHDTN